MVEDEVRNALVRIRDMPLTDGHIEKLTARELDAIRSDGNGGATKKYAKSTAVRKTAKRKPKPQGSAQKQLGTARLRFP